MKNWFKKTPKATVQDNLNEMHTRKALPLGRTEFLEWSENIILGARLPADPDSQRFALADLLTMLGPQESHKEDAFFIHSLRKFAINQVAIEMKNEIKKAHEDKKRAEAEAKILAGSENKEPPQPAVQLVTSDGK